MCIRLRPNLSQEQIARLTKNQPLLENGDKARQRRDSNENNEDQAAAVEVRQDFLVFVCVCVFAQLRLSRPSANVTRLRMY